MRHILHCLAVSENLVYTTMPLYEVKQLFCDIHLLDKIQYPVDHNFGNQLFRRIEGNVLFQKTCRSENNLNGR